MSHLRMRCRGKMEDMPSWNIHTAHVERLLSERSPEDLGIDDANAFLFGNYVPDIYLGFMVPDTTIRLDYCLTHMASPQAIPVPDADLFWDRYLFLRKPKTPQKLSLTLGAWAHLAADCIYNMRFKQFCRERGLVADDDLRLRKQGDFDRFGRALRIASVVQVTPELLDAAHGFGAYSILADDVRRSVQVARDIVADASGGAVGQCDYALLDSGWMEDTFSLCHQHVESWLEAWRPLKDGGESCSARDMRARAEGPLMYPDAT